ncbi:hypothetical protein KL942_004736 [Ogataea angusta]|uniref:Uncharacterized protein n=1 Tax=Pichia angusta TaxID=870730 RepID=A0ABQ7RRY0_PICAN|nr:hypothetical protein KL942_004736 [Ogataea angusta]KAG7846336.1 hypothetical protein KL940_004620 [Ogataea angusta]
MRDSIAQNPYRSLAFLLLYAGPAKLGGKSRPQCPCSYTVAAERGLCERQSVPVAIETDWLSRAQLFGPHAFRTDGIDNKTVPLQAHFGQPEASPLGLLGLTLHMQRLSGMSIQSVNFTAQSIPVSNRLAGLTSRAGKIDHVSERVNAML